MGLFNREKDGSRGAPLHRTATASIAVKDYRVYEMPAKERILYTLVSFAAGAVAGYALFGGLAKDAYGYPTAATHVLNAAVMLVTGILFAAIFLPTMRKKLLKGQQSRLKHQFRDMLEAFSTSLGAGKNVTDSFAATYDDLKNQYDAQSFILKEVMVINVGIANGMNVEDLLEDFGKRSGCRDIENFADVFRICSRLGGNIREAVKNTSGVISEKMEIEEDIETSVTGGKSELLLMLVLPVGMVGFIKLSSPDFAANFATPAGIMATLVGLAVTVAAFLIGRKILDIKV